MYLIKTITTNICASVGISVAAVVSSFDQQNNLSSSRRPALPIKPHGAAKKFVLFVKCPSMSLTQQNNILSIRR